jgi:flagellar biosynthesis protein FliQ
LSQADILHIASQAVMITIKLGAPMLLVSLAIGVAISLVQAVTSIQEATVTFVPKLMGVAAVMILAGGWMLDELASFTRTLFESIPNLVG